MLSACHQKERQKLVERLGLEIFDTEKQDSLLAFIAYDEITCRTIGDGAEVSDQWLRYNWLQKALSHKELQVLAKSDNTLLRALVFRISIQKKDENVFALLQANAEDTLTGIYYSCGCSTQEISVSDYFIKTFLENSVIVDKNENVISPTKEQIQFLLKYWSKDELDSKFKNVTAYVR
ncbi:hypothetical protein [Chondrinema litorale]|uniref:hypothetical protein n=1 Tax=Chondrinema litorale TaxID=2994555 RepID=UPI00254301AD|nr:hypothetical protein [Chondrinema litorale]UZR96127.1 hypothetical protein OQ292_09940 [Chondrinema litorale]